MLNLLVPTGTRVVEIAGGVCRGLRLELDLRREKYLWLGTYEPWVQQAVLQSLRPGDWAWDVGAHIGYHALLMWRVGARVVALEPDPINFGRLTNNLGANGAAGVTALCLAAGPAAGRARLGRVPKHPSQTYVVDSSDGECAVAPLDSLLADFPAPRLVKVDVEGRERDVLAGAERVLAECRPAWIVEVHGGTVAGQVIECFRRHGYRILALGKGHEAAARPLAGGPMHILAVP